VKGVLEPLARIAGVRKAMLVLPDGVPIVMRGQTAEPGPEETETDESLAALSSGWLGELRRAVAPLTWEAPSRAVLRASRGTLVLAAAPNCMLLVILDRGARPADVRLAMDGAVARLGRVLRGTRAPYEPPPPALPGGPAGGLPPIPGEAEGSAPHAADTGPRPSAP